MAVILPFGTSGPKKGRASSGTSESSGRPRDALAHDVPDAVWAAVESVRAMPLAAGVRYEEIAVPGTLADYGIGVAVTAASPQADVAASGWIMLLYDRELRDEWRSHWRCVAYARMPIDPREDNGLAPGLFWEEMLAALDGAHDGDVAGTVTVERNTAFGIRDAGIGASCELRASWTPLASMDDGSDAGGQVRRWTLLVKSAVDREEETSVDR
ncbi:DUF3000 family protein [Bifidobacterium leontopitheci]|uniref:Permease n=1 Tax=Bifidobacterium leontopitheci TaxID=2650774 RepID=A0A6I1GHE3_9BIFI|nr:DUF3000 family protein [Bifidobacterium leontopitheci]KAB7790122.1 Permease [Bifidobacterium leontopitheci]